MGKIQTHWERGGRKKPSTVDQTFKSVILLICDLLSYFTASYLDNKLIVICYCVISD